MEETASATESCVALPSTSSSTVEQRAAKITSVTLSHRDRKSLTHEEYVMIICLYLCISLHCIPLKLILHSVALYKSIKSSF